jgi:hypothetical protein
MSAGCVLRFAADNRQNHRSCSVDRVDEREEQQAASSFQNSETYCAPGGLDDDAHHRSDEK